MPWKIEERDDKYCVIKKTDGSVEKCHDTREKAKAHMAALYASEEDKAVEVKAATKKESDGAHPASHYLVVEDSKKPSTWHLRVRGIDGKPDHRLMGAAWAALHGGYRGNKYEGPNKADAIKKLKALYKREKMDAPGKAAEIAETLTEYGRMLEELKANKETLRQLKASASAILSYCERNSGPPMHLTEIKSTDGGVVIGGYMAPWGDPQNLDVQGDYFRPDTNFWLEHFGDAPAIFHHGKDPLVGKSVLGHRDDAVVKADGLWVQDWVDKSNEYWNVISALLEAKKLFYSPGSIPHLVEREEDGRLKSYPIVDDTFTPTPAQFALGLRDRALDYVKSAYSEAGLAFSVPDPLRGKLGESLTGGGDGEQELARAKLRLTRARLLTT